MAKREALLASLERAYEQERATEAEELHNAFVEVMQEQKSSIQNTLFVLRLLEFELLEAKYKEIMGVVKLTEKPPVATIKQAEEK